VVFRVTLLPLRHAELVSASSYLVMLNLIQHLKNETLKRVQGDVEKKRDPETSRVKHETLKRVQGDVRVVFRVT